MSQQLMYELIARIVPDQGSFFVQDIPNEGGKPRNRVLVKGVEGLVSEAMLRSQDEPFSRFFTPNGFHELSRGRDAEQVVACRSLYLDVDIDPSGKKEIRKGVFADCYKSKADAYAAVEGLCQAFGIPLPTTVLDSGRGVHVYWRLDQDVTPDYWADMGRRLKARFGELDPRLTVDTTRGAGVNEFMRLPGTLNTKADPSQMVWYLEGSTLRDEIPLSTMDAALPLIAGHTAPAAAKRNAPRSILSVDTDSGDIRAPISEVAKGCAQLSALLLDPVARNTHDGWKVMIHALAWHHDRDEAINIAMNLSDTSKGGGEKELLDYISGEHVTGAPTCEAMRRAMGDSTACQSCPLYVEHGGAGTFLRGHVTAKRQQNFAAHVERTRAKASPAGAVVATSQPLQLVAAEPVGEVAEYETCTLPRPSWTPDDAALFMSIEDASNFEGVWIDNAARPMLLPRPSTTVGALTYSTASDDLQTRVVQKGVNGGGPTLSPNVLTQGTFIHVGGVYSVADRVTGMFVSLVTYKGTVTNYKYRVDVIPVNTLFETAAMQKQLSAMDVAVSNDIAKVMCTSLIKDVDRAQKAAAIRELGWQSGLDSDNPEFAVAGMCVSRSGVRPAMHVGESKSMLNQYSVFGSRDDEMELLRLLCKSATEYSMLMYLGGVASGLMEFLDAGVPLLALNGGTGRGKTTALMAAQSAWGFRGGGVEITGNTSAQAPERVALTLRGIGMRTDEITTRQQGTKFTTIARDVLNTSSGQQRLIAAADGGLQATAKGYKGTHCATTNASLYTTMSTEVVEPAVLQAACARVVELTLGPDDWVLKTAPEDAARMRELSTICGGRIGTEVMLYATQHVQEVQAFLDHAAAELTSAATQSDQERFTIATCAAQCTVSEILRVLYPAHWTMSGGATMQISKNIMRASQARRAGVKSTVFERLVELFYMLPSEQAALFRRPHGGSQGGRAPVREPRSVGGTGSLSVSGTNSPKFVIAPGPDGMWRFAVAHSALTDYCRYFGLHMSQLLEQALIEQIVDKVCLDPSSGITPVMTDMFGAGTPVDGTVSDPNVEPAYHFEVKLRGRGNRVIDAAAKGKIERG